MEGKENKTDFNPGQGMSEEGIRGNPSLDGSAQPKQEH